MSKSCSHTMDLCRPKLQLCGTFFSGWQDCYTKSGSFHSGLAFTFRVTSSQPLVRTAARKRLPGTDSVLMMLKWVERHMTFNRLPRSPSPSRSRSPPSLSSSDDESIEYKTEIDNYTIPRGSQLDPQAAAVIASWARVIIVIIAHIAFSYA